VIHSGDLANVVDVGCKDGHAPFILKSCVTKALKDLPHIFYYFSEVVSSLLTCGPQQGDRLGEFLPIGDCFLWALFRKITEAVQFL
jgi:hypothetical protein